MDKTERTSTRTKKPATKSPSKKGQTTGKSNGKSNSTSVGSSRESLNNGNTSDGEMVIEDENTWECSVCTYRNSQETFKCLMCDVCKGTSTRKPRYNHDLVAQKVKKQQIQIHQKLLKSSKHQQLTTSDTRDSSDSKDNDKVAENRESKSKDHKEGKLSSKESSDDQLIERKGQHHGKDSKVRGEAKDGEGKEVRVKGGKGSGGKGSGKQSNESLDEAGPSVNLNQHSQHESTVSNNKSNHHNCSSSSSSPTHNGSSSSHLSPNANNHSSKVTKSRENLVKSPNKSLMRMKNIDRTNFLAQAVTVNNVTVIITEFQPKKKLKTSPTTKRPNQRHSTGTKDKN